MIFAEIPFKLKIPTQMSTKTTREQIYNEIKDCKSLFQVGCGSGAMSFDFLLNGGEEAVLLDHDSHAHAVARANAYKNGLTANIYCSDVQSFIRNSNKTFDAIIVSTAFLKPIDTVALVENCLKKNGIIITTLREDVVNLNAMSSMKEVIKRCDTVILNPIVNPEDNMIRLIYKGIKR